ncbi:unnamed protein product [Cyclocybe aegerita]|uniref:Uncharacterized protein n=1 Tax=Cyclocybe aegerita TaxID=1973307 RepID=A0A8S0WY95_CYCAE|nr:unnamed protein product [Cyclocybe aegerita]
MWYLSSRSPSEINSNNPDDNIIDNIKPAGCGVALPGYSLLCFASPVRFPRQALVYSLSSYRLAAGVHSFNFIYTPLSFSTAVAMFYRFATFLVLACSFSTVFSAPVQRLAILRDIEGKVEARGARQGNPNVRRQVDCAPVTITRTVTVDPPAATPATPPAGSGNNAPAAPAGNLQPFAGALGGQRAPAVTPGGRGFQVENNASFQALQNALQRSCDVQKNLCANVANSASGRDSGLTVGQCDQQGDQCRAGIASAVANGGAAQQAPAQDQNNQAATPPAAPENAANNGSSETTGDTVATAGNLQSFAGALGGQRAPTVTPGGRGFQVENNASFQALQDALQRSCDVQKNLCANVANSNAGRTSGLTVNQCDAQGDQCRAGIATAVTAGTTGGAAQKAPTQNQNQNNQAAGPPATPASTGNAGGGNLQPFAGALGGERAPSVTAGGRGFQVEGNASFLDLASALRRSCDVQKNKCANVANSDAGRGSGLTVGQCDQQGEQCRAGI